MVISLLAIPWTLKPIWSPMLEMYKTKKFFVVLTQFAGGLSLVLLGLLLNLPDSFRYTVAMLAVLGFCSATHDIAADGIYIADLTPKEQAAYVGWQGAFYNLARIFCMGGLLWLVGVFGEKFARAHLAAPLVHAWMLVFAAVGLMLFALSLYHAWMLPAGGDERKSESIAQMATTFWDVVVSFFKKPNVLFLLLFIFLYRTGEGQVIKVGPLFLRALRSSGGLELSRRDLWSLRQCGLYSGQCAGRLLHSLAGIEEGAAVAGADSKSADDGLLVSERGAAHQSGADHGSDEYGDVRLRIWFCGRDSIDDARDRAGKISDGALRFCQRADEPGRDSAGSGERVDSIEAGLYALFYLGHSSGHTGTDSFALHSDSRRSADAVAHCRGTRVVKTNLLREADRWQRRM
jgi:hypothetical protein